MKMLSDMDLFGRTGLYLLPKSKPAACFALSLTLPVGRGLGRGQASRRLASLAKIQPCPPNKIHIRKHLHAESSQAMNKFFTHPMRPFFVGAAVTCHTRRIGVFHQPRRRHFAPPNLLGTHAACGIWRLPDCRPCSNGRAIKAV